VNNRVRSLWLVAEFADVDGVGWERHEIEVHGPSAIVCSKDGAEEATAEMKTLHVGLERELD
jgi:hypothetical protein